MKTDGAGGVSFEDLVVYIQSLNITDTVEFKSVEAVSTSTAPVPPLALMSWNDRSTPSIVWEDRRLIFKHPAY